MRLDREGDSYVLDLAGREFHLLLGALDEHAIFRGDRFQVLGYSLAEAQVLSSEVSRLTRVSAQAQGFPPVPVVYRRSPAEVEALHRNALEVFRGEFEVRVVGAENRIAECRLTLPRRALELLAACLEEHIRLVGPGSEVDGFPHSEAQALSEALTLALKAAGEGDEGSDGD